MQFNSVTKIIYSEREGFAQPYGLSCIAWCAITVDYDVSLHKTFRKLKTLVDVKVKDLYGFVKPPFPEEKNLKRESKGFYRNQYSSRRRAV